MDNKYLLLENKIVKEISRFLEANKAINLILENADVLDLTKDTIGELKDVRHHNNNIMSILRSLLKKQGDIK